MRLRRVVARGFRNLAPLDLEVPASGVALLGANGAGKTNVLEAIYYPVLFRSFRGAADAEVARFGGEGFHAEVAFGDGAAPGTAAATWTAAGREKRLVIDGAPVATLAAAAGRWLAVAFLPSDTGLASGAPTERRQFLDRMLALACVSPGLGAVPSGSVAAECGAPARGDRRGAGLRASDRFGGGPGGGGTVELVRGGPKRVRA